ncbi:MAG: methyltransferase domain-containing protein [Geoalkalibacter sp.]|jgi:malonyl-CoA O-methyltransferase|uniref:methyltransferase domain-containing protein n=1 Tax=Geoalkalibacter sp. TaxID=3041440 RepID=UPI002A98C223|nr:methyltransferase domain-containing protein [Thermodesulfobacteriota bacterium]
MNAVLSSRLVRARFSSQAGDYDRFARVQKRVAARLAASIEGRRLSGAALDVGTGTGELACSLRRTCPDQPLVLCDIAPGMTRYAASRIPGALAADADAQSLPFRDGVFGLVASASVYQWMNDLEAAFRESARILRSGGLFAFAFYGEGTLAELRKSHLTALREAGCGEKSYFQHFPSVADSREALLAAGLQIDDLWRETEVEWHADPGVLLRSLKRIGAQNAHVRRPRGLASRRVMLRMNEVYRREFGTEQGIPATYNVIFGLATRL